jgi:hypothetical protein
MNGGRLAIYRRLGVAPGVVASRELFHLEDVGSHVGEQHPACGARHDLRELDHLDSVQCAHLHYSFAGQPTMWSSTSPVACMKAYMMVRPHEGEAALLEVPGERIGFGRGGGHALSVPRAIDDGLPADEGPHVVVEAAELLLHGEEGLGVLDGALDLQAVTHDAGIEKELFDLRGREARDLRRIEFREEAPVVLALGENGGPRQSGLGALEREEFEEDAVVVHRLAPFAIVVRDVLGAAQAPAAALLLHLPLNSGFCLARNAL